MAVVAWVGRWPTCGSKPTTGSFRDFLTTVLANMASQCADGALVYSCMDWRRGYELQTASRKTGLKLLNLCVWNKDNGA